MEIKYTTDLSERTEQLKAVLEEPANIRAFVMYQITFNAGLVLKHVYDGDEAIKPKLYYYLYMAEDIYKSLPYELRPISTIYGMADSIRTSYSNPDQFGRFLSLLGDYLTVLTHIADKCPTPDCDECCFNYDSECMISEKGLIKTIPNLPIEFCPKGNPDSIILALNKEWLGRIGGETNDDV